MKKMVLAAMVAGLAAQPALAQQGGSPVARPSVYAVNAAALSAAMTYCTTKYGSIGNGTPGAGCFARARTMLADMQLSSWSRDIDQRCTEPANYNRCMTPWIGRLVQALNDAFKAAKL